MPFSFGRPGLTPILVTKVVVSRWCGRRQIISVGSTLPLPPCLSRGDAAAEEEGDLEVLPLAAWLDGLVVEASVEASLQEEDVWWRMSREQAVSL